ncbi:MAG TPA: endo-1,4-beta-xylanase [Polyangiaceae bacterium]|nr:endo-1,4-beta-xylanase [Polyangiaceae bacterium]
MTVASSALKLVTYSSIFALSFWTAQASAQSAGSSGATSGGASGSAGASTGGAGGAGGSGGASSGAGGTSSGGSGGDIGGAPSAGASSSSAGAAGSAGMSSNLITNGTFDSAVAPWWSYANNTDANPADITMTATDGQLCGAMTAGGKNVWDIIMGISGLSLMPNQYYHIGFTVKADAPRTIKFKIGLGDKPYTDYFIEPIAITADSAKFDYTYLNLRTDPMAQFQFQIGKTPGTVCVDNIVVEPVAAPIMTPYKTSAPSGHPFKDYKAFLKMGTAVDTPIFLSNPQHNAIVATEFAMITPANSMKMNLIQPVQGTFDFTDTDALSAWAQNNGIEFRGHPLIWHTQAPDWLNSGSFDRQQMIDIMYAHIDALMGRYKGKFPYWDVVNEAIDGADWRATIWHDRIGADFMDLAFTHARAADPAAKLFYNDYNSEQKGNPKADKVFEIIKDMKTRGIPIDGVGLQGHYYVEPNGNTNPGVPDMQAIRDNMARYAEIGVEVQITECDFRIGKPLDDTKTQLQNDFYKNLLQACIDAPNCSHFTVWGLSDLDSWVPSTFPDYDYAHIFDSKLMPKPAYTAMSNVFAKYNTDGTPIGAGGAAGAGGGTGAAAPSSSSDSGGCSLAPRGGSAPWLLTAFGMLGALLVLKRSKRNRG